MMSLFFYLTLVAALGSGLVAGMFFAFSTFIMKALDQATPTAGISVMQAINKTVINPWFLTPFMGTAALGIAAVAYGLWQWHQPASLWLVSGGVLYGVGTFGVTIVGNVPMNETLAAMDATHDETEAYWRRYLSRWTFWNHVRTAAAALANLAFILATGATPA